MGSITFSFFRIDKIIGVHFEMLASIEFVILTIGYMCINTFNRCLQFLFLLFLDIGY